MKQNISLATALLLSGAVSAQKDKCYGVAMSGGGAYGAFEAGGLYGMWHAV